MGSTALKSKRHLRNCEVAGRLVETAKGNFRRMVKVYDPEKLGGIFRSPAPKKVVLAPPLLIGGEMWRITESMLLGEAITISTNEHGGIGIPEKQALEHACAAYTSLETVEVVGPNEHMQSAMRIAGECAEEHKLPLSSIDWGEYSPMPQINGVVIADTDPRVNVSRLFMGENVVVVHSPGCMLSRTVLRVMEKLIKAGVPAVILLGNGNSLAMQHAVSENNGRVLPFSSSWIRNVASIILNGKGNGGELGDTSVYEDNYLWTVVRALNLCIERAERPVINNEVTRVANLIKGHLVKVVPMHLNLKTRKITDI